MDHRSAGASVRVGIDVGGTFTHAVSVEATGSRVLAEVRVPTTHEHSEGVAAGVVQSLEQLLAAGGHSPEDISRVAHSTTQATNALLEGDVAPVGVLAVGSGWEGKRAAGETALGSVDLAPGRTLTVHHRYLESHGDLDEDAVRRLLQELIDAGAQALVAAGAFSVDDPEVERRVVTLARDAGLPATATHEVSGLYGLRMRTRTAAVNAAILPRMLATANHTEAAVRRLGVTAPLVVMRSDGGAMDLAAMRDRPLLTLLSGPAAGVAAALMVAGVSDGIFLEVGGTSSDISCFVHGRPKVRMARLGEHRIFLDTLDVRTLGVAGGSMVRLGSKGEVVGVGPRSAHIAGLEYAAFGSGEAGEVATRIAPRHGDPAEYLALGPEGGPTRTLTPSCAAVALGKVEDGDKEGASAAFQRAGELGGGDGPTLALRVLEVGAEPLVECVQGLLAEYRLDAGRARLVAGGGGGAVWGPEVAAATGLPYELAPHAPVLSALGAALALLQETVERNVVDAGPEELLALRREAEARVLAGGAAPETVEVRLEVDAARGVAKAIAIGAHALGERGGEELDSPALAARAASAFGAGGEPPEVAAEVLGLTVFASRVETRRFFGFFCSETRPWRVLDQQGRVRLGASHGEVVSTIGAGLIQTLRETLNRGTRWGDAGARLPDVHLLARGRIVDLSGLPGLEQRLALAAPEADRLDSEEPVALVVDLEGSR